MKPGVLIYKCRLCGGLDKSHHSPDVDKSFREIERLGKTQDKGTFTWGRTDAHLCANGATGVTDLAGYEEDK